MNQRFYSVLSKAFIRMPLQPVEFIFGESGVLLEKESLATSKICADDDFMLSLLFASPSTFNSITAAPERIPSNISLQRTIRNYKVRYSTRPTPFGTFAGVGLIDLSDSTHIELQESNNYRISRVDMSLLCKLARAAKDHTSLLTKVQVMTNHLVVCRGERFLLQKEYWKPYDSDNRLISIRANRLVKTILKIAQQPLLVSDLIDQLEKKRIASSKPLIFIIQQLINTDILLAKILPSTTDISPVNTLGNLLCKDIDTYPMGVALIDFVNKIAVADQCSAAEAPTKYSNAVNPIFFSKPLNIDSKELLTQIDSGLNLVNSKLNAKIAPDLIDAVQILLRLSPFADGPAFLGQYKEAFIAKYNEGQEVPFLEFFDKEHGLLPYVSNDSLEVNFMRRNRKRNSILLELAMSAAIRREREIVLIKSLVDNLQPLQLVESRIPPTLDIFTTILASSESDIDEGNFDLLIGPNIGAAGVGRALARFSHVIGQSAIDFLKVAAELENSLTEPFINVETVFYPEFSRLANVTSQHKSRRYQLYWDCIPDKNDCSAIFPSELAIGMTKNKFYVRWLPSGKKVRIFSNNLINLQYAPLALRFLCEAANDGQVQLSAFSWGEAENLAFVPRVRVGKVILRPAEWHLKKISLSVKKDELSSIDFEKQFRRWCKHWNVPSEVYLTYGDNRLLLDLNQPDCVNEIHKALKKHGEISQVILQEFLPNKSHAWIKGNRGHHLSEVVFSLVACQASEIKNESNLLKFSDINCDNRNQENSRLNLGMLKQKSKQERMINFDRVKQERHFLLGSKWLYIKLYISSESHDNFIVGDMKRYVDNLFKRNIIDKWFFVRYSDPEPHLRLRLCSSTAAIRNEVLPNISGWVQELADSHSLSRCMFDTYDREIERYGGIESIDLVEAIFYEDSKFVDDLLTILLSNITDLDRDCLGVISVDIILEAFGFDRYRRLDWTRMLVSWSAKYGNLYRKRQKQLLNVILFIWGEHDSGPNILRMVCEKAKTLINPIALEINRLGKDDILERHFESIVGCIIHMHLNRLMPLDDFADRRILALLYRSYGSIRAINGT